MSATWCAIRLCNDVRAYERYNEMTGKGRQLAFRLGPDSPAEGVGDRPYTTKSKFPSFPLWPDTRRMSSDGSLLVFRSVPSHLQLGTADQKPPELRQRIVGACRPKPRLLLSCD